MQCAAQQEDHFKYTTLRSLLPPLPPGGKGLWRPIEFLIVVLWGLACEPPLGFEQQRASCVGPPNGGLDGGITGFFYF